MHSLGRHVSGIRRNPDNKPSYVEEVYPLPSSHRLWSMPNVLITPHVSGGYHARVTHDRIIGIADENLRRLVKGEKFTNLVDMSTGYRKTMEDAHK